MNEYSNSVRNSRSVSRAVARSRSVRAAARRRRGRVIALVSCVGVVLGAPLAWWMAEPAAAVAAAAVSEVQDLADLLAQRSPGTRTRDQLTKHARLASPARDKGKIASASAHPAAPGLPTAAALIDLLQPRLAPVGFESGELPEPLMPPPTLGAILSSSPVVGPPGDSSGLESLPSSEPRELVTQSSAVPEPGTWAMMLAGFGLIAWRLRRRRGFRVERC